MFTIVIVEVTMMTNLKVKIAVVMLIGLAIVVIFAKLY